MNLKTCLAAVAAVVIAVPASAAIVIDFQSLEIEDAFSHNWGYVYDEDGFRLSHPESEPFEFATFGTLEGRYPGSTALFNNTAGGVITLEQISGDPFDMVSIDISNLNNNGPVTVNFTGNLAAGGQVFADFTTSGTENGLETFSFEGLGFEGLESLVWTQESPFHQFDNITIVPAPGALALLGMGLFGRRRRRS
jgi:hypothetical protein